MRLRHRLVALLLLPLSLLAVGCVQIPGVTLPGQLVDVYDDAYLEELRETLLASDSVTDTTLKPGFYERRPNIPPQSASVSLAEHTGPEEVAMLLDAATAVADSHGEAVPTLVFADIDSSLRLIEFSGVLVLADAEEVLEQLVDAGWVSAQLFDAGGSDPVLRTFARTVTIEDAHALVAAATAPLPSALESALVSQRLTIDEPKIVESAGLTDARITREFVQAMVEIDRLETMLPDGAELPTVDVAAAKGPDGYVMSARVRVWSAAYEDLERDEIRVRAEADGYAAFCDEVDRLVSGVPDMATSGTVCRVNAVQL